MKVEKVERGFLGAVAGKTKVTLHLTDDEIDRFNSALHLIQRYEEIAIAAIKERVNVDVEGSDWCMIDYLVKHDCNKVVVHVRDGMAG
jgi:hypothetical protein